MRGSLTQYDDLSEVPIPETPSLPQRIPHNQAMATTLHVWRTRNRNLFQRTLDGLRQLDRDTAACRSSDPIRGYAHAHQVMAVHAGHHCARYEIAGEYAVQVRL